MLLQRTVLFLTVFSCLLGLTGCGSSTYLLKDPYTFTSCADEGKNPQLESFKSIRDIVTRKRGWILARVDDEQYMLKARVTRGAAWIPLEIRVKKDGNVTFLRDPDTPKDISGKWANNLKRWLTMLEADYSRNRCRL